MKRILVTAAAMSLWAGGAQADAFTDQLVASFRDKGFTFIEVQDGLTQVKVEGVRGTTQLEVIYDRATGKILKQESEPADARDIGRTGVRIRQRNRDFVSVSTAPNLDSAVDTDAVVDRLRTEGYDFIEIKRGPTQTKVEATRGNQQVEIVFDNVSGQVLKRETGPADAGDVGRSGIEVDTRDRDFLSGGGREGRDDDDDDDDNSRSGSSGSGSSGSGSGSSGSGSNSGSGSSNSGSGSSGSGSSGSGSNDD